MLRKGLHLYKKILKAHSRHLPIEMRQLGDAYVRSEFRSHKDITDEKQLDKFFKEWETYYDHIKKTARVRETMETGLVDGDHESDSFHSFGSDLDKQLELTTEQEAQLRKLKEEASSIEK